MSPALKTDSFIDRVPVKSLGEANSGLVDNQRCEYLTLVALNIHVDDSCFLLGSDIAAFIRGGSTGTRGVVVGLAAAAEADH